jgi:predicted DNA-binding ribbon-helix-helix protein
VQNQLIYLISKLIELSAEHRDRSKYGGAMETTTVRVRKITQERLKKLSTTEHVSITELIDNLVEERERSFGKDLRRKLRNSSIRKKKKQEKLLKRVLGDGLAK